MYPRRKFEMTEADLEKILEACKPVPMIMLQCGTGRSPQERANDAWKELGGRMGFDHMTVEPTGEGSRFFSAVPSETEAQRNEREERESQELKKQEIASVESKIAELQARLHFLNQ